MPPVFYSVFIFFLICSFCTADFGPCRFDAEKCSCKIGAANQGICWDRIVGQPGRCSRRYCQAGWTCACAGRSHVCTVGNKPVNVLTNDADVSLSVADCETSSRTMVSGQDISLGTLKIHISKAGVRANDCTQISWWHNGVLLGNRGVVNGISSANTATLNAELSAREDHALLELRPGDLIAFRFKEGSYYCYNHLSEMVVDGTKITSNMNVVTSYYAREFSQGWFLPSYKLTASNTAADENESDLKKFLPLRSNKLVTGLGLIDGTDYWEPRDDSNADNKRSNWYFRIQIADDISSAATNEV